MLIHQYQSSWIKDFENIKEVILSNLNEIELRVEHVGSTSIKGLSAKPIIDIDVVYDTTVSFDKIKEGLYAIGYHHIGDLGITDREAFKREQRKVDHPILDCIDHHLYVCPIHSVEFHRHITFRDYLRANEKERKEYEKIKIEIAEQANQNKTQYALLKEDAARDFVESVLRKAEGK